MIKRTMIVAEVGINHAGQLDIAKKLIDEAKNSGADAVKFQKRDINSVYTREELDKPRNDGNPYGWKTQREQKEGLEFGKEEYDFIVNYCREKDIEVFATAWDLKSLNFLKQYNLLYNKVASPLLVHEELLRYISGQHKHTFISTGMSTMDEIDKAVKIFEDANCKYSLLHCNSAYPMPSGDANLLMIKTLQEKYLNRNYPRCNAIGYSGHSTGIVDAITAVALGATIIEKHITLDRSSYGSDQSSSLEPIGFSRMVDYIRTIEVMLGDGVKNVTEKEESIKKKLRRYSDIT